MNSLPYRINPDDPRAPPQEVWERLSAEERAHIVASLPSEFSISQLEVPKGDPHYEAKSRLRETLRGFFSRVGRKVYLACGLPVHYPDEPVFAPDVMAVAGVDTHLRMHWRVSDEQKGLDWVLDVHVLGDRRHDLQQDMDRYARLGIREYWVFDQKWLRLSGWRLSGEGQYRQLMPEHGFYQSEVLGLELQVEDGRLRFYRGRARLPEPDELINTLEQLVDRVEARNAELEQQLAEEQQCREEAERQLAEALAELERLRGGRS